MSDEGKPTQGAEQGPGTGPQRRLVRLVVDDRERGFWHIEAMNCPLWQHQRALGQELSQCAAGVITNCQGPVKLGSCKHLVDDSLTDDDIPTILCTRA